MTRKDSEAIAASIKAQMADMAITNKNDPRFATAYHIASAVARAMAKDNERFNRARFLQACGFPPV